MWNPASPSIPPLTESDFLVVEDILVSCRLCPSLQLTHANLAAHIKMHDRRNHLLAVSKVERCEYARGMKKNKSGGDFILEAELVKGVYSDCRRESTYSHRHSHIQKNLCTRTDAARCALKKATPFATLPYIEDQIYTFGDKYLSREEQGEFIFILIIRDDDWESWDNLNNYFELSCKYGRYWIRKTTDEDALVRLNKVDVLDAMLNIPLAPGDIISVANTKKGFAEDYLFKLKLPMSCQKTKKSVAGAGGRETKEEMKEVSHYFFNNTVVLSQIFRRMNVRDILPLRLVAKFWNEEALSLLKTRIVLTPFGNPMDHNSMEVQGRMTVFKLAQELGHMAFKKWKVGLPYYSSELVMKKLLDDFRWLFSRDLALTRHVTELTYCAGSVGEGRPHDEIWAVIFDRLAPTLESLSLKTSPLQLVSLSLPSMPWVTTFVLEVTILGGPWPNNNGSGRKDDNMLYAEWIKAVFLVLPRLKNLTLEGLEFKNVLVTLEQLILVRQGNIGGRSMLPCAVSIISSDIVINESWLGGVFTGPRFSCFYVRRFVGTIVAYSQHHQTQMELLYHVLNQWANSLEEMDLKVDLGAHNSFPMMAGPPPFCLKLPSSMPRLGRLTLSCVSLVDGNGIRIEVEGQANLEYSRTFPTLLKLKLCLQKWGEYSSSENIVRDILWEQVAQMYDFFLPRNEDEVLLCDTLRVLEVPLVIEGQVRRHPEELQRSFPKLTSLPLPRVNIIENDDDDDSDSDVGDNSSFPDFMKWPAFDNTVPRYGYDPFEAWQQRHDAW